MMDFTRSDEPVDAQNATIEAGAVFEDNPKGCMNPLQRRVVETDGETVTFEVGFDDEIRTMDIEAFEHTIEAFDYQRVDADAGADGDEDEPEIMTDGGQETDESGETRLLSTHDVRGELRDHGVVGASVTNNRIGDPGEKDYVVKIGVYSDCEVSEVERVVDKSDVLEWYSDEWDHREHTGTYGRYVAGEVQA